MSEVDTYEPDLLCIGLIHSRLEIVREALHAQLESTIDKAALRSAHERIDWRRFFECNGQFFEIKRFQIALLSTDSDLTVYVCNLADGWISLFGNLVETNALDGYFFRATLAKTIEYKVFEMKAWRKGAMNRHVCALQDDGGWNFVNHGEPLAFESAMQYRKQPISARLNRSLLEMYSEAAGCRISSIMQFGGQCWRFWRDG